MKVTKTVAPTPLIRKSLESTELLQSNDEVAPVLSWRVTLAGADSLVTAVGEKVTTDGTADKARQPPTTHSQTAASRGPPLFKAAARLIKEVRKCFT